MNLTKTERAQLRRYLEDAGVLMFGDVILECDREAVIKLMRKWLVDKKKIEGKNANKPL